MMTGEPDDATSLAPGRNTSRNPELIQLRIVLSWALCAVAVLFMLALLTMMLWAAILDMESGESRRLKTITSFSFTMVGGFVTCLMGAGIISVRDYLAISKLSGILPG